MFPRGICDRAGPLCLLAPRSEETELSQNRVFQDPEVSSPVQADSTVRARYRVGGGTDGDPPLWTQILHSTREAGGREETEAGGGGDWREREETEDKGD